MVEKASEAELISEMEAKDRYSTRYYELKYKCEDRPSLVSSESSIKGKRSFKLPPIEFKKYSGDLIDWLPFWSQFKVVHDDPSIDLNDKIAYLRQATVDGSKARRLVESFPAVADNYSKIIKSLKSRFGREDLQIEVYIRELLKLILSRVSSSSCNVSALYDMIESQLRSLETLGITADKYAAILYPLIESCLPEDMIRLWHRSSQFLRPSGSVSMHNVEEYAEVSTLETRLSGLMSFLQNEVQNEQKINLATEGFGLSTENKCKSNNLVEKKNIKLPKQGTDQPSATAAGLINYEVDRCIFCEGQHDSINCFKAKKLSMEQKRRTLSEKKACFRCLKVRHSSKKCRARLNCILCCKSHVVLMCPDLPVNKIDTSTSSISHSEENRTEDQTLANLNNTQVFLQTLRVNIRSAHGTKQVRALIDTGSQRTYILQRTAQEMGFSAKGTENIVHTLFGGKSTSEQRHKLYKVTASEGAYSCSFDALDQPKICADVSPVYHGPWVEELSDMNISLSDVGHIAPIEILLGADVVGKLYTGRKYQLQCGLVAVETLLGWTLMGKVPAVASNFSTSMMSIALFVDSSSVAKLWELDIIGITDPVEKLTREVAAKEAKNFFYETIRCDNEGRYEVMLPWLNKHPLISDNLVVARRRLDTTLNKLKKSNLFESYNLIFNEWLNEGVIEIVNNPEENNCVHYLPHRPVIKNTSETTKIRPVFDASSHEQGRPSLNQCLEVGPNLIELIPSVLLRFRQQKIGVVSDIRKAFLQISVHSKDRDFLRFLWVNNEGKEFVFRHRRVVFGVNCSPFLLGATIEFHLIKALEKCCNDMPYSKNTIERLMIGFYVDNCVTSVTDENELRKFVSEATAIMEEAKMDLRGWESSGSTKTVVPVLGLLWDSSRDTLKINGEIFQGVVGKEPITKRLMLSVAQSIFDPIGFTCPVSLFPKLLLQKLWEKRLGWDAPVENDMAEEFCQWVTHLPELSSIEIPRWIQAGPIEADHWSLHTFSDASKKAYAAVVFLRVLRNNGVSIFLVAAKSRVAPLKKISIPRLELLAATIGARLYQSVKRQFSQHVESYFWSDSTTVLSWIQRKDDWSVFVFNRVQEIRNLANAECWKYVPGSLNPADLPSRGCGVRQLFESRWWEGPEWLYRNENYWPQQKVEVDEEEVGTEKKKKAISSLLNMTSDDWHLRYFSQYTKLLRMMAWTLRFCYNTRNSNGKLTGELVAEEIDKAEMFVLKLVQKEAFGSDTKRISSLNTFVDEFGLIRLKTRVTERIDTEDFRLPILLPGEHFVVRKLILSLHKNSCHVGTQGLLSLLREKYWTLGGRRIVRSILKECGVCKRQDGKSFEVQTPSLPADRVRDAAVFEISGVDLAGPLYLKSGEKAWICLFTCAVYRAVHLELVTSLSTNAFIQAFRRFVARRGRPRTVYSDNGTNFTGLENALKQLDWNMIAEYSSTQRIKWRFNPPTAAWWGGFWERLIGIVKGLLRKVLGRASLNYEDLLTLLCDCESIVNSRPLTYISDDPTELAALTPGMFLREQVSYELPDCDLLEQNSLTRKIRRLQELRSHLRKRFRAEYLAQLKAGTKKTKVSKVSIGDVVLVGNENIKRLQWPLGKVIELLPGRDNQVRLVRLATAQGQLLRPLQRLYPVEVVEAVTAGENIQGITLRDAAPETVPQENDCQPQAEEESSEISAGVTKSRAPDLNERCTRSGRVVKTPVRFK